MRVDAIATDVFPLGGDLSAFCQRWLAGRLGQPTIVAVTSKIVSLAQSRLVDCPDRGAKRRLIERESDYCLNLDAEFPLAAVHGCLLPVGGIDQSNSPNGQAILLPEDPSGVAKFLHDDLASIHPLGILIVDSGLLPGRRGTVGMALGFYGFHGVESKVGERDLFGRQVAVTSMNVADSLATACNLVMGEVSECRPLAVVTDAPVRFGVGNIADMVMPKGEDVWVSNQTSSAE